MPEDKVFSTGVEECSFVYSLVYPQFLGIFFFFSRIGSNIDWKDHYVANSL